MLGYKEKLEELRYEYSQTRDFGSFARYIGAKELKFVTELIELLKNDIEKTEVETVTELELKKAIRKLKRMLR